MTRVAAEKSACSSRISVSDKPIWSFQNRVMMAMGNRAIFSPANRLRRGRLREKLEGGTRDAGRDECKAMILNGFQLKNGERLRPQKAGIVGKETSARKTTWS